MAYGAEFLRWFSEEVVRIAGRWSSSPDGNTRLLTMKQPVGPTLMITPWNFPLAMGTRKIGPAIAAGCTMAVKPTSQTPLSMRTLVDLFREVRLPEGVLNVITTSQTAAVMEPLITDSRLRKLTFTGSTPVGQQLVKQSATQLLMVSMEAGRFAERMAAETLGRGTEEGVTAGPLIDGNQRERVRALVDDPPSAAPRW